MACTPAITAVEYENATTSSGSDAVSRLAYKRRHSSFHPLRTPSLGFVDVEEKLLVKVDLFLTELERRLDFLEHYGNLDIDSGVQRAYATLQAVRARCSQVSDEVLGEGRRRAKIMVETLEARYQDALIAKETLNEKIAVGVGMLDAMLSDFETRAYKLRDQGFVNAAGTLMDEGRRVVDGGLEKAQKVVDEGFERAKKAAESLEEHIAHAVSRAREHGVIHYDDLPIPWRINPHIHKGYRFSETKIACVRSIFLPHNEMFNIWSHVIGLLIVLAIAFHFYPNSATFYLATKTDIFIAAVFFFAACKCLVCSCLWHTMSSVADQTLMERFACVDYTGISLLIAASIMTTEYTAFYCEPISRWIYLVMTATLGIAGTILPWHPTFNRQDMAWLRVGFFVSLGASGFIPIIQLNMTRGAAWAWQFYAPIAKSLAVYLLGACVYASKIPERWCPGAFDYIGGSHNLWHVAVLGGIFFHYAAMHSFFADAFRRAAHDCMMR